MKVRMIFVGVGMAMFVFAVAFALFSRPHPSSSRSDNDMKANSVLDFTMETIDGEMRQLSLYKGNVKITTTSPSISSQRSA